MIGAEVSPWKAAADGYEKIMRSGVGGLQVCEATTALTHSCDRTALLKALTHCCPSILVPAGRAEHRRQCRWRRRAGWHVVSRHSVTGAAR